MISRNAKELLYCCLQRGFTGNFDGETSALLWSCLFPELTRRKSGLNSVFKTIRSKILAAKSYLQKTRWLGTYLFKIKIKFCLFEEYLTFLLYLQIYIIECKKKLKKHELTNKTPKSVTNAV